MKLRFLYVASFITVCGATNNASAQNACEDVTQTVRVDKIRYCRTIWPVCNDKLQDEYRAWEDNGVPDQAQKNTYIAQFSAPRRENVENVVLIAAGQRFGDIDHNMLTGQCDEDAFRKQDAHRFLRVARGSLARRLFEEGVFEEQNTFAALAFDARFNWGFSEDNKRRIVNAYSEWLSGKFEQKNLRSIYLVGHSRGGALVMRLAKKLQAAYPNAALILHPVDAVPRRTENELGSFASSTNNPVAGFPRDSGGLNNLGNWAWQSDLGNYFDRKEHLSVFNMVVGGKIFGLAQETRAVTDRNASSALYDNGWYRQQWYTPEEVGADNESGDGHDEISKSGRIINAAIAHLRDRLEPLSRNIAPEASIVASSTYCRSPSDCYSPNRAIDRSLDTRVGPAHSWVNDAGGEQWLRLQWPEPVLADGFEVYTSERYPIRDFRIEALIDGAWVAVGTVQDNTALRVRRDFAAPISTSSMRLVALEGPDIQGLFKRVNEWVVFGEIVREPNDAPVARCSASPSQGPAPLGSVLSGRASSDTDGTIVSYQWSFGDGSTGNGVEVSHVFAGDPTVTVDYTVRLTVTDDDGATDSATCRVVAQCPGGGGGRLCPIGP